MSDLDVHASPLARRPLYRRRKDDPDPGLVNSVCNTPVSLSWPAASRGTPPIVIYSSEKGGVGKSSMVAGCAACAAAAGLRVLVIDLDPRAGVTDELGVAVDTDIEAGERQHENQRVVEYSTNDLLYVGTDDYDPRGAAADMIVPPGPDWPGHEDMSPGPGYVHVLPAERALGNRESDPTAGFELRLALGLQDGVLEDYDLVLVDMPPRAGGKLVAAAIIAATHAIIPVTLDEDGYEGARQALMTMHRTRRSMGMAPLTVVGLAPNIVQTNRTSLAEDYIDRFHDEFEREDGTSLLLPDVLVPRYVIRQEARSGRVPITISSSQEARAIQYGYIRTLNAVAETLA